ncbi:TonB-dependent receptor [Arenibacter sp. M-2]|uniref:SusC/RagA family TonB-linked outer membrane protein n=1 Tax=Arenibacter sp. M-2 TaxID=3053612 RepID=UPI002570D370|nr:TonB-dependent receptor [Arenibacter sp. M-2]MDL5512910.1 TonB-dependent receptor [Arenibacter sp. M-2]
MKKLLNIKRCPYPVIDLDLKMKLSLLFLLVTFFSLKASDSYAQRTKITLNLRNVTVGQLIDEIESTTEFQFVYKIEDVDLERIISIQAHNDKVDNILNQIFNNTRTTFNLNKRRIFLVRRKEVPISKSPKVGINNPILQDIVKGTVSDKDGNPLPGTSIVEKGTANGVTSDFDGKFSIELGKADPILIFSYVGFASKEVSVNGQFDLNVSLEESAAGLDEVVVVGYGTQKRTNLTGSVTVVKITEINEQASATGNVLKAMDGRIPGIKATYNGDPNNAAGILIRGKGSLSSSNEPLVIIDGVPTNRGLNELAVNDIESIQVLKDASAATIYGSRAANGVFIVTTKSADEGMRINFTSTVTAGWLPRTTIPLLNTEEYGRAQWQAARNDKEDPNYGVYSFQDHQDSNGNWVLDKIDLPEYLDEAKTMKPANTNWEKVITRSPISRNYNVSVSQGGKNGGVLFSFDYLDSEGTTKENGWNRGTIRLNSTYNLFNNRVKFGENLALIKMRYTGGSYLSLVPTIQSIVPVRTIDGEGWGGPVGGMSDRNNPLLVIMNNRQNHKDDIRLVGSAFGDFEIMKNLHLRSTVGIDYDGYWNRQMNLQYQAGYMSETVTKMQVNSGYGGSWTWNNIITYDFSFKNNEFNFMIGQEATKASGTSLWGARDGFASEDLDYLYLDVGESNVRNGNGAWDNSQNSYFGRLNYNFKNRYLLTAIVRRDGSSRFGANNRFATFPSLSGGWVLSQESFLKSTTWLSFLKIRYGWGKTGNQEIDNYASYGMYQARYGDNDSPVTNGTAYDLYGIDEGNLPSGYRRLQLSNPDLKWEATTQNNIGLDYAFLGSKLSGTFDYYIKRTSNILVKPPTLRATGYGASSWINGANMKNSGWETTLAFNNSSGDFNYSISASAYKNINEFTYIIPEAVAAYPGNGNDQTILGRPLNSYYGYVVDGIFQNQAEVDNSAVQPGKGIGRLKYGDINNDGIIDADDRDWIGVNEPELTLGLSSKVEWKGFDFSMFWNSELGREVPSSTGTRTDFFGFFGGQNYGRKVLDSWSPTNTSSTIPAISKTGINDEQRFSSYFIENTSYVKLQSLVLGYTLPKEISKKVFMTNTRIYLQGENLRSINLPGNTFSGFDPKSPNIDYPLPTSITLGFNLTF